MAEKKTSEELQKTAEENIKKYAKLLRQAKLEKKAIEKAKFTISLCDFDTDTQNKINAYMKANNIDFKNAISRLIKEKLTVGNPQPSASVNQTTNSGFFHRS